MKYKIVKAQQQGTSMALTVPVISDANIKHDYKMIEESFDHDALLTEEDMKKRFGRYGWD
ncbi:hypothetical protein [uncultured Limosilactobacillus sp.]|uniref:hypothetical protein n=1 Tax=uncultured Limosilactobacillus sp. TaxID=2837629 RepID=UPI0025DFA344|nr:hypothetical protein [uncultured Limosilactobacillus sp.]